MADREARAVVARRNRTRLTGACYNRGMTERRLRATKEESNAQIHERKQGW